MKCSKSTSEIKTSESSVHKICESYYQHFGRIVNWLDFLDQVMLLSFHKAIKLRCQMDLQLLKAGPTVNVHGIQGYNAGPRLCHSTTAYSNPVCYLKIL